MQCQSSIMRAQRSGGGGLFVFQQLLVAFLPDHFEQVEDVLVLVLDVALLEVHLALVEQVGHVLVTQVPPQEPPEHALQPQLLGAARRQQFLQVAQADHYFFQDGLDELHEVFVGHSSLLAASAQQFLVVFGQHLSDAALHHVDGDVLLVVVLEVLLLPRPIPAPLLLPPPQLLRRSHTLDLAGFDGLEGLCGAGVCFLHVAEEVGAAVEYEGGLQICFKGIH